MSVLLYWFLCRCKPSGSPLQSSLLPVSRKNTLTKAECAEGGVSVLRMFFKTAVGTHGLR